YMHLRTHRPIYNGLELTVSFHVIGVVILWRSILHIYRSFVGAVSHESFRQYLEQHMGE
ncbi:hypothetical protein ACJX0J_037879, partial [Zea mays]